MQRMKNYMVQVRMPAEMHDAMMELARQNDRPLSAELRVACKEHMAKVAHADRINDRIERMAKEGKLS